MAEYELLARLVRCSVGYPLASLELTVQVVVAYLMRQEGLSRDEALASVRQQRSVAWPNEGFMRQLLRWQVGLCPAGTSLADLCCSVAPLDRACCSSPTERLLLCVVQVASTGAQRPYLKQGSWTLPTLAALLAGHGLLAGALLAVCEAAQGAGRHGEQCDDQCLGRAGLHRVC